MTRKPSRSKPARHKKSASKKPSEQSFRDELVELIPFLRAFSYSICHDQSLADDMAQEALTKAWRARASFKMGTNMKAWLFTILRNELYSNKRRAWRQTSMDSTTAEAIPGSSNEQLWTLHLSDLTRALNGLNDDHRDALILVGAAGFSYEETAQLCNCTIGTVKSRVSRARSALADNLENLELEPRSDGRSGSRGLIHSLEHLVEAGAKKGK